MNALFRSTALYTKIIGILFALAAFYIAVTSFKIFIFLFLLPFQPGASA